MLLLSRCPPDGWGSGALGGWMTLTITGGWLLLMVKLGVSGELTRFPLNER